MRKHLSLFLCLVMIISLLSVVSYADDTGYVVTKSELEEQNEIDAALLAEAKAGYTFDDPLVVVNPYGTTPLSAVIIFDTEEETGVTVTSKGHEEVDNITATFPSEKNHILPVLGLYAGQETDVELTLDDGTTKNISVKTDPIDEDITTAEIVELDENFYDFSELTFLSYYYGTLGYDSKGDVRFFVKFPSLPMTKLSNGHYIAETMESSQKGSGSYIGVVEFDLVGRIYGKYILPGGAHHEIREMENGNLLVASSHDDLGVVNCRVVEIERSTGSIIWDLDLCDIMDTEDGVGYLQGPMNAAGFAVWFHDNSFDYDAETNSLIISGRIVDAVVCIDKDTKELKWILGTNEGWNTTDKSLFFTPVGDDFEWQYAQHNVTVLPDDDNNLDTIDLLMFDNGCARIKENPDTGNTGKNVYSRAVVFHLNTKDMTVSQEWQYGKERGDSWYSAYISGAFRDDEETNVYWICSGGIQLDPATGNYDLSVTSFNGDLPVKYTALVDEIVDNELKYELKFNRNVYRSSRWILTDCTTFSEADLTVPGALYTYE